MTDQTAPQPATLSAESRDALLSRYLAIKDAQKALEAEMDAIKGQLADAAFATFGATGEKTYAPGVGVRELTEVTLNAEEARKWVMEDAYGRSQYLTVNVANAPVLVGFLLSQPMFHGMLTLNPKPLTDSLKEAHKKGETVESVPYERLNVQISTGLQLAITDKDTGLTPAEYPHVMMVEPDLDALLGRK